MWSAFAISLILLFLKLTLQMAFMMHEMCANSKIYFQVKSSAKSLDLS